MTKAEAEALAVALVALVGALVAGAVALGNIIEKLSNRVNQRLKDHPDAQKLVVLSEALLFIGVSLTIFGGGYSFISTNGFWFIGLGLTALVGRIYFEKKLPAPPISQSPPILATSTSSSSTQAVSVGQAAHQSSRTSTNPPPIGLQLKKSLSGLVGLDFIASQLEHDFSDFLDNPRSRALLLWGPPGTGKTEIAQRLAGTKEGIPGLILKSGNTFYISGVDGKLEIKNLVDQMDSGSILFIDEADKCLDPNSGMVSKAEAVQIVQAIVTHFSRKDILWIFLGTFTSVRGEGRLTHERLANALGQELTTRIDFADWGFPSWTAETLLKAVASICNKRGNQYDDDALILITNYCLRIGGGVRAFDTLDQAFGRRLKRANALQRTITKDFVEEYFETLGTRAA